MQLFRRKDLVKKFTRQCRNWVIIGREADSYRLRSNDTSAVRYVSVRHRPDVPYLMFFAGLPLRFPLDRTPSGLFARMLLRNVNLRYCSWNMDLQGSYEASAYLSAQWPTPGMTAAFFDSVCREMTDEIRSFHQELRDKFRGMGMPEGGTEDGPAQQQPERQHGEPRPSIRYSQPAPQIRHPGPAPASISQQIRARMLENRNRHPEE